MEMEWIADRQREREIPDRNAMDKEIFEEAVLLLLPDADTAGVDRWSEFASGNVSREQYVDFEPMGTPVDKQAEAGRWLGSLFAGLYQVAQTYGVEMAEQLWECGIHHSCLYPYEMLSMAEHLQKGGSVEDVENLIQDGALDSGPPFFVKLGDILSTDSLGLEQGSVAAQRSCWADECTKNRAHLGRDLASGSRQLYELEKELRGQDGAFSDWLRAAYEINEDFEQPLAEVIGQVCASLREVDRKYGSAIAQQLYNTQAIILPTEIGSAAHFLSLGGHFEFLARLAQVGFFMEDYKHDAMARAVQFMNGGGAADEVYQQIQETDAPERQEDGGPHPLSQWQI